MLTDQNRRDGNNDHSKEQAATRNKQRERIFKGSSIVPGVLHIESTCRGKKSGESGGSGKLHGENLYREE